MMEHQNPFFLGVEHIVDRLFACAQLLFFAAVVLVAPGWVTRRFTRIFGGK